MLTSLSARGAVIVNDTFDIGSATRTNEVVDPLDVAWWSAQTTPLLSVADDSGGIGSGNALQVNSSGGNSRQIFANQFGIVGLGANIGDRLELSFDFRFINIGNGAKGTFQFGFYNDNGSTIFGDNQKSTADNDSGYFAEFGIGNNSAAALWRENGGGGAILDGNDLTDLATNRVGLAVDDLLAHTVRFTLTRSATNAVHLALTVDGITRASGEDYPLILTTFNELTFANKNKEVDYRLDNVSVTGVAAPEPSSAALFGLGASALVFCSRRLRR